MGKIVVGNPAGEMRHVSHANGWAVPDGKLSYAPRNKKYVWLFDLKSDPEERTDLSSSEPERLSKMLKRVKAINATQPMQQYWTAAFEPKSDPRRHHGFWVPWKKDKKRRV